jgi:hypothetical protein
MAFPQIAVRVATVSHLESLVQLGSLVREHIGQK